MVGDFSRFKRFTVTPSSQNYLEFAHDFGLPKVIIINYNKPDTDLTNYLCSGIFFLQSDGLGYGVIAQDVNGENKSAYRMWPADYTLGNGGSGWCSGEYLKIRQVSSAVYFKAGQEYTVDFYA